MNKVNEYALVYGVAIALGFSRKEADGLALRAISKPRGSK